MNKIRNKNIIAILKCHAQRDQGQNLIKNKITEIPLLFLLKKFVPKKDKKTKV